MFKSEILDWLMVIRFRESPVMCEIDGRSIGSVDHAGPYILPHIGSADSTSIPGVDP